MYKIIFTAANGEHQMFSNITEIEYGADINHLKKINNDEVLTHVFPTAAVYHLIGTNSNVTYIADNTIAVFISGNR